MKVVRWTEIAPAKKPASFKTTVENAGTHAHCFNHVLRMQSAKYMTAFH